MVSASWDNNDVDLAQAGTEQDVSIIASTLTTTYRAWTELLPNQPAESVLSGVPINPGDTVFTEVWIGSVGGGPSLTAPSPVMTVCLEDLTGPTGVGGCFNYTSLAGTVVGGGEAEWIMERPTQCDAAGNCSLTNLADFGSVA